MQLSFSHIMKHWKRNQNAQAAAVAPKTPGSRNTLLRFYPPQSALGTFEVKIKHLSKFQFVFIDEKIKKKKPFVFQLINFIVCLFIQLEIQKRKRSMSNKKMRKIH